MVLRQKENNMKKLFVFLLVVILLGCAHIWIDSSGTPALKSDIFECDLKCRFYDNRIAQCKSDCMESNIESKGCTHPSIDNYGVKRCNPPPKSEVFDCDQVCVYLPSDSPSPDLLVNLFSTADIYANCSINCMHSKGYK